jgi:hypothetical protein
VKALKKLKRGKVYLSYIDKKNYNSHFFNILKSLKNKKVCIVSLNKRSSDISSTLKSLRIPEKNFFFIDTVSLGTSGDTDMNNAIYVSAPKSLTELSIAITSALNTGIFDALIFDSLSTVNALSIKGAGQFTSDLVVKLKDKNLLGIFTCLKSDDNTQIVRSACLNMDGSLEQGKLKPRLSTKSLALLSLMGAFFAGTFLNQGSITGHVVSESQVMGNLTGYAVLPSSDVELSLGIYLVLALIIFGIFTTIYGVTCEIISNRKLSEIKAKRQKPEMLRKTFKDKIKKWIKK